MKKTLLLTIAAIALLLLLSFGAALAFSDNPKEYRVTFKLEFTTPVELPEGYSIWNDDFTYTERMYEGAQIGERDMPLIPCIGDAVFEGWDKDPYDYTVTSDMTFTAKINNDGCVPVYFKSVDENGNACFSMSAKRIDRQDEWLTDFDRLVCFAKKGKKLTEGISLPILATVPNGEYEYVPQGFTPNPEDLVINKSMEFVNVSTEEFPEDVPQYTVYYKAKFTTPVDMPDDIYILTSRVFNYRKNSIIRADEVPQPRFLGDGITFEGWDTDPVGTVVTESMTFTAIFNNDDAILCFFRAIDEDGKPIPIFADYADYFNSDIETHFYRTFVTGVKKGETLTDATVPFVTDRDMYGNAWEEDPRGYVAEESKLFTFVYKYYYIVLFNAPKAKVSEEQYVRRGEAAFPPEVPEMKNYIFVGWNADYSCVTDDMYIEALIFDRGDVNMDGLVNTTDAVRVLKACAGLTTLEGYYLTSADVNSDGTINTFDAVYVLRIVAGMGN